MTRVEFARATMNSSSRAIRSRRRVARCDVPFFWSRSDGPRRPARRDDWRRRRGATRRARDARGRSSRRSPPRSRDANSSPRATRLIRVTATFPRPSPPRSRWTPFVVASRSRRATKTVPAAPTDSTTSRRTRTPRCRSLGVCARRVSPSSRASRTARPADSRRANSRMSPRGFVDSRDGVGARLSVTTEKRWVTTEKISVTTSIASPPPSIASPPPPPPPVPWIPWIPSRTRFPRRSNFAPWRTPPTRSPRTPP